MEAQIYNMQKSRRVTLIAILTIVAIVAASTIAFFAYVGTYYHADESIVPAFMSSDEFVNVEYHKVAKFYSFEPKTSYDSAFVFIPGGKVEAKAYAPLMHEIAKGGVLCILLEVKFNLAILDKNAPKGIQDNFKDVNNWIIGGHSLGGTVASIYLSKNPTEYKGIVFLGSYPQADLSSFNIKCLQMYGTCDKVLKMDKYEAAKAKCPKQTREFIIEGGNHAQFGAYGAQKGDRVANISNSEQWAITAFEVLQLFA